MTNVSRAIQNLFSRSIWSYVSILSFHYGGCLYRLYILALMSKREELIGSLRKLHIEDPDNL
jgi:hypothetical protein